MNKNPHGRRYGRARRKAWLARVGKWRRVPLNRYHERGILVYYHIDPSLTVPHNFNRASKI